MRLRRGAALAIAPLALALTAATHSVENAVGVVRQRRAQATGPSRWVRVLVRNPPPGSSFRAIGSGYGIATLSESEAARLTESSDEVFRLPQVRLTTDVSIPIVGVPKVEADGLTGRGAIVGAVDSGFDVAHPSLRNLDGTTRMAWLLDYSRPLRGKHVDLETKYGEVGCIERKQDGTVIGGGACSPGENCHGSFPCAVTLGAVYASEDIDALLRAPSSTDPLPSDEEGHGTLVLGVAAGTRLPDQPYRGVAPDARLVGVKGSGGFVLEGAEVLMGTQFIFDRAASAGLPASVNLSLTSTLVTHDGDDGFASALATMTRRPGQVIIAAAGNTGDPSAGVHQSVSVGGRVRLPIKVDNGIGGAEVSIIVSPHPGANIKVGCDAPTGTWVTPTERGTTRSAVLGDAVANVIFDPKDFAGRLSAKSTSAFVLLQGSLSAKDAYFVVLEGTGTVDLWMSGGGFAPGVREQTLGSPAMHPEIIAVGATISRIGYRSVGGEDFQVDSIVYDEGGFLKTGARTRPTLGQVAAFSAAGPGLSGSVKPDLVAPGTLVISAASSERKPGSEWATANVCPLRTDGARTSDKRCALVAEQFGTATGTSFASPFVAGAAAVLLQVKPDLTQQQVRVALQSGVHRHRATPRFVEAAGVGELDVAGAVDVVRAMGDPKFVAPVASNSWATPNSHYAVADGTRPLRVMLNLKRDGAPADGFDAARLRAWMDHANGRAGTRTLERLAPGLWEATFEVPADLASTSVTIHATFDDVDVVRPFMMPVASDPWQARYPASASGASCEVSTARATAPGRMFALGIVLLSIRRRLSNRCRRSSLGRGSTCSP